MGNVYSSSFQFIRPVEITRITKRTKCYDGLKKRKEGREDYNVDEKVERKRK